MRIPFAQIDAFANLPFEGNPAAVMPLAAWLDDDVLQRIAAENNLAETAFIVAVADGAGGAGAGDGDGGDAGDGADFALRWFTPMSEVVMCGHATLASGHFVLSSDSARDRVRFRTRQAGMLEVARVGDGYELALPAWAPSPRPLPRLLDALGLDDAVATLWHEHRYGLVVLGTADQVRAVDPDFRKLAAEGDWLTIVTAPGDDTDIVSRAFAPGAGIDEDPVTGSAHAVMVPYWAERLGRDSFSAYQASRRGGRLACRLVPAAAEAGGDRVVLGGRCVTVIEGTFFLP